jgi:hypothetical protein
MRKVVCLLVVMGVLFLLAPVSSLAACDTSKNTICTIEIWLGYPHKKNKRDIKGVLKGNSLKVLRHTVQYWKPKGGHPPTNIAIGRAISARDAQWAIEFALKYNDNINGLIHQKINPPNYVAIATSAWDDNSETPITKDDLSALRNPKLTTEEFHLLYLKLTQEATGGSIKFY